MGAEGGGEVCFLWKLICILFWKKKINQDWQNSDFILSISVLDFEVKEPTISLTYAVSTGKDFSEIVFQVDLLSIFGPINEIKLLLYE